MPFSRRHSYKKKKKNTHQENSKEVTDPFLCVGVMPLIGGTAAKQFGSANIAVINESLIRECILLSAPQSGDDDRSKGRHDKSQAERLKQHAQTMDLCAVTTLMFSYKQVVRIDNLFGVDNITKLMLDNNAITKIENLSHLKHLQWLDLSFNKISEMEGLDDLTSLQDLSLYANKITVVKGLDKLTKLSCLSLGKNDIDSLDDTAKYLHKLHHSLRMLTLQGNKVEQQAHYRPRLLAYLPNLKFLDNRLIVAEDIAKAREEQRENLVPIDEEDAQREVEQRREAEERQTAADYRRYNCPNEAKFFDEIFQLQPEGRNMVALLDVEDVAERIKDIFDRYREDTSQKAKELADIMKALRLKRDADDKAFADTVEDYKARNSDQCRGLMKAFERDMKKQIPFGLKSKPDPDAYDEEGIRSLRAQLDQLNHSLLELEADQYEAIGSVIAVAVGQYKADAVDQIFSTHFEQFQKIELDFQTALRQRLDTFYEERQKQDSAEGGGGGGVGGYHGSGGSDQVKQKVLAMLDSKDEYQKALAEWQELHRKKLEELEQTYIKQEEQLIKERNESILKEEHRRNRSRVGEVHAYHQRMTDMINQWEHMMFD